MRLNHLNLCVTDLDEARSFFEELFDFEFVDRREGATMTHMERVGIREMRQNLSRYTARTRNGEAFVITDRGSEVARLVPAPDGMSEIDRLVVERGARRGVGNILEILDRFDGPIPGPPSEQVLEEMREERF